MMCRTITLLCALLLFDVAACGSSQQPEQEPPTRAEPVRDRAAVDDGMVVEGLRGTLQRDEVDPILNRAARRFQHCYVEEYMDHPYLVGDLALQFTIDVNGTVDTVWSPSATLGSRDVEECILGIARALSFPRPHGGAEAQFDYGPMVMSSDDHHPFDLWALADLEARALEAEADGGAETSGTSITQAIEEAESSCLGGSSGFNATLYIGPGGNVRTLGVVAPTAAHQDSARCLERELSNLQFPDPGTGRIIKLSLEF